MWQYTLQNDKILYGSLKFYNLRIKLIMIRFFLTPLIFLFSTFNSYANLPASANPVEMKEVTNILSKHFNTQIHISSITQISEKERRNLILRINIQSQSNEVPSSIILKQAVDNLSDESTTSNQALSGFARDWAGLEFLSTLKTDAPPIPKFYGGSIEHRFVLMEDLGKNHTSLVDSLTCTSVVDAENSLIKFMDCLGQLHACAYAKTDNYFKILNKIDPSSLPWKEDLNKKINRDLPALELLLKKLDIIISENLFTEMANVFTFNLAPGPFTTLIHGDICPDNVFDNREKNELHLIDFELSFIRNALLDGTYLRMSFPTCWCAKALPNNLIDTLEASYRKQLKRTIPAARDDLEYSTAYVHACAFWMLKSLLLLDGVLVNERIGPSGPTPPQSLWQPQENLVRPRILSRLIAFIEISKTHKQLPALLAAAEQILQKLEMQWPDAKPLEFYPVFCQD